LAEEFTFEEGTEILGRILELVPEDLDSRHRLASLLVVKRPQDAILELKEFVRHASRLSEADPRLADVYETLSSLDPALPLTGPKVNAYLDAGNKDAAERELRASLETTTPDLDLLQAFERLHKGTDSQSTHELLAKALLESGQVRRGVAELGRLAVRATDSGDDGGALAAYEMALDFDPFDWETRSALAELLLVSEWLTNLRALCDIARIRGDTEIASAMLGVYVREAPDDLCSRLEWIETLIASESADALTALSEFESTCEDQQNLGLRNWAREQAKRLGGE
jgi:tetratricopeptide (TPR) repeat protein